MKRLLCLLLSFTGLFLAAAAHASPPVHIQGIIRDFQSQLPIQGVTIKARSSKAATVTDVNGKFALDMPENESAILISIVGYESQELTIAGKTALAIDLKPTASNLNEVVVIGYGTQKKADITSAVASVKASEFVKGSVIDAGQLIQGKVAGVSVSVPSGDPTGNSVIMLRGITSLASSSQPLILIDGIPGNLNTVAPEDIESVDVLKDGSAAAIYGTRGTNGVILITTKKAGINSEPTIDYSGSLSVQQIAKKLDLLDAADYKRLAAQGSNRIDYGHNTDWFKEVTRTPFSQIHNLSLRGGNNKTNYVADVNYRGLQGIFLNSDNKTFTGHLNINHSMFDGKLKAMADLCLPEPCHHAPGKPWGEQCYQHPL